ncbi:MAG TPA: CBS domain-containing protein [Micromonosporaceae bacterium]|jgi:CBS domain-containing protein|nr:CBS domain-containing protein [Micromonosporaceae bacterium]
MRAADLAADFPMVTLGTSALEAARLLAAQNLPGLVVLDDDGRPSTILPGTQVLRLAVPRYIQDDPALARVIDEAHADLFLDALDEHTVRELLPREPRELAVVRPQATVLEVAALMARTRSPLVVVADKDGIRGCITLDALLDRILGT